jgi:hypothetical protein
MIPFKGPLIAAVLIASILGYAWYEHTRFLNLKIEYQDFIENSLALQLKKEKEHAIQLNVALGMRDDAYRKLRFSEDRARSLQRSLAAAGVSRVCYSADGLNTAYRELVSEIRAIAGEGQAGLIDNKAWLDSWPQ